VIVHLKISRKENKIYKGDNILNINNLNVGMVIKNYKELCNVLEIEIKKGTDSKKGQLKELERYCKYVRSGHSFTIKEIYETPISKTDNRGKSLGSRKNNTVYGELIQFLILDLLVQGKNNGHLSIGRNKLMKTIGMVNENYSYGHDNVNKISKYIDINENVVYDFYNTTNSNFKSTIDTALKNLYDKRIISYDTVTKVNERNKSNVRLATEHERSTILECEKLILQELGFDKVSEIRNSIFWNTFKYDVKKLIQSKLDIEYYFIAYDITINEKFILDERKHLLDFLLEDLKRKEYKDTLNGTIILKLLTNATKRYKTAFTSGKKYNFRLNKKYVDDIKRLINIVVDHQTGNVINRIMNIDNEYIEQINIDELIPF
jgi:hypothetical protein